MAVLHLRDVHGIKMPDEAIKKSFSRPLAPEAAAAVVPVMKQYICDLSPNCGWRYVAMTEDLIADGTAVHAREVHGIRRFTPQMMAHIRSSIREWSGAGERKVA
jgi:predicted small metal-binding protein